MNLNFESTVLFIYLEMPDHPKMYDDVGCAPPHIGVLLTPAVILYSEGSLRLLIRMNFQLLKEKT